MHQRESTLLRARAHEATNAFEQSRFRALGHQVLAERGWILERIREILERVCTRGRRAPSAVTLGAGGDDAHPCSRQLNVSAHLAQRHDGRATAGGRRRMHARLPGALRLYSDHIWTRVRVRSARCHVGAVRIRSWRLSISIGTRAWCYRKVRENRPQSEGKRSPKHHMFCTRTHTYACHLHTMLLTPRDCTDPDAELPTRGRLSVWLRTVRAELEVHAARTAQCCAQARLVHTVVRCSAGAPRTRGPRAAQICARISTGTAYRDRHRRRYDFMLARRHAGTRMP